MSTSEIIQAVPSDPYILTPVMNISLAKQRLSEFQSFVRDYLVKDEDFGEIPGAKKPTLLKPGADKLCELYGLADDYEFIGTVEDFDKGIFDYTIKCILTDRRRGCLVSTGLGSCNSLEQKYRWRDSKRLCPQCGKETIIKGKEEYGGGFICFAKKGGCGAKFSETDKSIIDQTVGRTLNEDVADLKNTILKMAKKRAKVDATLSATRSSGVFTQDIEDMPHFATPDVPPSSSAPDHASQEPGMYDSVLPKSARPVVADIDIEAERAKWLDMIGPTSPDQFIKNVAHLIKAGAKGFVASVDAKILQAVFDRLEDADVFSAVLCPLIPVAMEMERKSFVNAVATEAMNRKYTVDRVSKTYKEGKSK